MVMQLLAVGQKKDTLYIEVDLEKVEFSKYKMAVFADSSRYYFFNKKLNNNNNNCEFTFIYNPADKYDEKSRKVSTVFLKNKNRVNIDWFHKHNLDQIDSLNYYIYYEDDFDNSIPDKKIYLFEKQELEKDSVTIYRIGISYILEIRSE